MAPPLPPAAAPPPLSPVAAPSPPNHRLGRHRHCPSRSSSSSRSSHRRPGRQQRRTSSCYVISGLTAVPSSRCRRLQPSGSPPPFLSAATLASRTGRRAHIPLPPSCRHRCSHVVRGVTRPTSSIAPLARAIRWFYPAKSAEFLHPTSRGNIPLRTTLFHSRPPTKHQKKRPPCPIHPKPSIQTHS